MNGTGGIMMGRTVVDPIHGLITLPDWAWEIINTPQFHRLRMLKQLGVSNYVFPGAVHTRFEHSIGTCHLAYTLMNRLATLQPELEIDAESIRAVGTAGLCHDLGHGPFSHAFEHWANRGMSGAGGGVGGGPMGGGVGGGPMGGGGASGTTRGWRHEDMSITMFEHLVDENAIDMDRDAVRRICSLIAGTGDTRAARGFEYDVVANKRNSVDVDKFDYLMRDRYYVGVQPWNCKMLHSTSRVIDGEICYTAKLAPHVYRLFSNRYEMFSEVYCHRTSKGIELMVSDCLAAADGALHISDQMSDPRQYVHLTDGIMETIYASTSPELEESRDLIKRIHTRDLYRFCDDLLIPASAYERYHRILCTTPEDIAIAASINSVSHPTPTASAVAKIRPEQVRVHVQTMNYAFGALNPVDNVHFFDHNAGMDTKFAIPQKDVSSLLPTEYAEKIVCIYAVNERDVQAIQRAFQTHLKHMGVFHRPPRMRSLTHSHEHVSAQ